jgi:hypothetical protein
MPDEAAAKATLPLPRTEAKRVLKVKVLPAPPRASRKKTRGKSAEVGALVELVTTLKAASC